MTTEVRRGDQLRREANTEQSVKVRPVQRSVTPSVAVQHGVASPRPQVAQRPRTWASGALADKGACSNRPTTRLLALS